MLLDLTPWIAALLALALAVAALRRNGRKRLILSLPTSRTDGVFIGLVELNGSAESPTPLTSHLAGVPCVHYSWSVEEQWRRTVVSKDSRGRSAIRQEDGWTTVASGTESQPFYLKDAWGAVLVHPQGAKLETTKLLSHTCGPEDPMYYGKGPAGAIANSRRRRRFVEHGFALHAPLFIVGRARERSDAVAPEIANDRNAEMFLISSRTEEKIVSRHRTLAVVYGILGLVLLLGSLVGWDIASDRNWHERIGFYALATLGYGLVLLLGWTWSVYNALVTLRNRVRHGLSLVDVQLHRRHDLIPNLLRIVEALRGHERDVQAQLAALRAEASATQAAVPGADPHAVTPMLKALREAYPELDADQVFLALQKELIATENRIALARDYFNNIATHYNTCLAQWPDRAVATLARMKPQPLLAAADFEREKVEVEFAR